MKLKQLFIIFLSFFIFSNLITISLYAQETNLTTPTPIYVNLPCRSSKADGGQIPVGMSICVKNVVYSCIVNIDGAVNITEEKCEDQGKKCDEKTTPSSAIACYSLSTPVPTEDNTTCGDASSEDVAAKKCCCVDVNGNTQDTGNGMIDAALRKAKDSVASLMMDKETLKKYQVSRACDIGVPSTEDVCGDSGCMCKMEASDKYDIAFCKYIKDGNENKNCVNCSANKGVWTAIGCIYFSNWKTVVEKNVFGMGLGLAGAISFLCIIYATFLIQTSSGNAEKIKNAKQLLTSCLTGLVLIIFSVFILRLIGVNIIGIPGLK